MKFILIADSKKRIINRPGAALSWRLINDHDINRTWILAVTAHFENLRWNTDIDQFSQFSETLELHSLLGVVLYDIL